MAMPNWLRFVSAAILIVPGLFGQQQPAGRFVDVVVTDSMNRFVTGLTATDFTVRENGIVRRVTSVATPEDSISIAVFAPGTSVRTTGDVMLAPSAAGAVNMLGRSRSVRKALLTTSDASPQGVPSSVIVIKVDPSIIPKAIVEAQNRYVIGFDSADANAITDVLVKQPAGLPTLKVAK
jgi:hypothetical protein